MRISVTIAAFNEAARIRQALDSVAAQERIPDEVIVCDDGSTDETADIAERHPVVTRVIRRENGGLAFARNDAIEASTGDLVANLDADDIWHQAFLDRIARGFEAHPDAAIAFSRYRTFMDPQDPADPGDPADAKDHSVEPFTLPAYLAFDRTGLPVLPSFTVLQRSYMEQIGARPYVDGHRCGENLMVFPLMAALGKALYLPAWLGRYRLHNSSITSNETESARWLARVVGEMIQRSEDMGLDREARSQIRGYAAIWSRMAGRRLGGSGFKAEGRAALANSIRQGGGVRSLLLFAASLVPGVSGRVWRKRWRPEDSNA